MLAVYLSKVSSVSELMSVSALVVSVTVSSVCLNNVSVSTQCHHVIMVSSVLIVTVTWWSVAGTNGLYSLQQAPIRSVPV